ncbi:hypothetical protein DPEC_G00299440 [Dallia pectoralis]|uniref:Uncharacterized protein n=1 Tax=Dallia pectoralis TaxID=75939 RepID=A0ACC2FG55_DALPE|nr:hypothetical protein DPEC_G00299440 [Dallia pectoralis]
MQRSALQRITTTCNICPAINIHVIPPSVITHRAADVHLPIVQLQKHRWIADITQRSFDRILRATSDWACDEPPVPQTLLSATQDLITQRLVKDRGNWVLPICLSGDYGHSD